MPNGILNIDGFNWSALKLSESEHESLLPVEKDARLVAEQATFSEYHQKLRLWIEAHGGIIWNTIGDCTIAGGFPSIDEAVAAAETIQRRLSDFNKNDNKLPSPLIVRIGVATGVPPEIPSDMRGEHASPVLDEAGHLQKDCPPGRIRISRDAFNALRFGRDNFRPGLNINIGTRSTNSLIWIGRTYINQENESIIDHLASHQRRAYPVLTLSAKDYQRKPYDKDFSKLSEILEDAFVIIGETRQDKALGSDIDHPATTSDAVGILEIVAALKSSDHVAAGIDEWVDSGDMATQKNIVIIGSPEVNLYAHAANTVTPAGFSKESKGLLRIRVPDGNAGRNLFFPGADEHSKFDKHFGLVLLTRSPINPKKSMLWIAGISGIATQAASRFVRDLVLNPTSTIDSLPGGIRSKPNIAIVAPAWQSGYDINQYSQGGWRVSDYRVVWVGRQS